MGHHHQAQVQHKTVEVCNDGGSVEERRVWGIIVHPLVNNHAYNARAGRNAPAMGYARCDFHTGTSGNRWDVSLREL